MSSGTKAVIDVGTNSVKLLAAEIRGSKVKPLIEESEQTRLGQGFYETHRLRRENIENTGIAVARYAAQARSIGADSIMVFATSAARDAINAAELITEIEKASGLKLRVISGDEEADWVFRGVTSDERFRDQNLLVMDVGGGSTEFVFGRDNERQFSESFQIGTVRLLEKAQPSNPPRPAELAACHQELTKFLADKVRKQLDPLLAKYPGVQLVGTGGTANILARMEKKMDKWERSLIEEGALPLKAVLAQRDSLWRLPIEERRRLPGLPPKRADVILMGAAIYYAVMEQFGFEWVTVSTRGLRYAALLEMGEK